MDLLYAMQNLREMINPSITAFFMVVSDAMIYVIPAAVLITYWCIDKEYGKKLCTEILYGYWINGIAKLSACIYRPWIRDPRLHVFPEAEATATGYSFPSAHTTVTAIGFFNLAERTAKKALKAVCIIIVILVMISRMWLGCHSLADVTVGLIIGILMMLAVRLFDKNLGGNPKKEFYLFAGSLVLAILSVIFIETKQYPMDYDAAGKLIVDPDAMKPDTYSGIAMIMAWPLGLIIEKKHVGFTTEGSLKTRIIRFIVGALLFVVLFKGIKLILGGCDPRLINFVRFFVSVMFAACLYPWLVMKWRKRKNA